MGPGGRAGAGMGEGRGAPSCWLPARHSRENRLGYMTQGRGGGNVEEGTQSLLGSFVILGQLPSAAVIWGLLAPARRLRQAQGPRRVLATGHHLLTPRPALGAWGPAQARAQLSQLPPRASVSPARGQGKL